MTAATYPKRFLMLTATALFLLIFARHCGAQAAGGQPPTAAAGKAAMQGEASAGQVPASVVPAGAATDEANTVRIRISDAIVMALEHNRSLAVERLNPEIQQTFEQQQEAVFDPVLSGQISGGKERAERQSSSGRQAYDDSTFNANVAVDKFFATGTSVAVTGDIDLLDSSLYDDQYTTSRLGVTVTQALLQGYGIGVNLASIRQARLDTAASQYELRGFAEELLNQVEAAYWDYALAKRQIAIVEESLHLAEQQRNDTQEMIKVGKVAESELVATEAAIASRRQALIAANSDLEIARLNLLRLLNPPGPDPFKRQIALLSQPDLQQAALGDVADHVTLALRMRPDLNQARLELQRDELEIVKTRNGLLPILDFFITLGKTGYADSFSGSIGDIGQDSYDVTAGFNVQYPFGNRKARALHSRSQLSRDQDQRAMENLAQLVEVDVRSAYIAVSRAFQQIAASKETRRLQEENLRIETEKFKVGRSTNFLVAQAQRDLLASQLVEVQSIANYLKALTDLYRQEGSLLERRGVSSSDYPQPKSGR